MRYVRQLYTIVELLRGGAQQVRTEANGFAEGHDIFGPSAARAHAHRFQSLLAHLAFRAPVRHTGKVAHSEGKRALGCCGGNPARASITYHG